MSLRTVRAYVAQQAGTISTAGTVWRSLNAYAHVPKQDLDGHRCMAAVGEVRRSAKRLTPPRGVGMKERVYSVDLLLYATHDDAQKGGDAFDLLAENAETVFATVALPAAPQTDPVSGQTSTVTHIGEDVDLHVLATDTSLPHPARVAFRALLTLEVREILTPA